MAPTFQFEENRLVYSLRVMAYPGDSFGSEESVRCAYAVTAARRGDRTPPKHETNMTEWNRVLDILLAAEPKEWVEGGWAKPATATVMEERAEAVGRLMKVQRRPTEL